MANNSVTCEGEKKAQKYKQLSMITIKQNTRCEFKVSQQQKIK